MLKELNNYSDIGPLADRACRLYQEHGSPESGAAALDKAAKIVENIHPDHALKLYQQACDVSMVNLYYSPK